VGTLKRMASALTTAMAAAVTIAGEAAMVPLRAVGRAWAAKEIPDGVQAFKKQMVLYGDFKDSDPFLFLAEDWIRTPGGFEPHPHRGFSTVSILFNGKLEHKDYSRGSSGASAVVEGLDCQIMTTGRGIVHSEMPVKGTTTHMLQLWVNHRAVDKMCDPGHQEIRAKDIPVMNLGEGYAARVISGTVNGVAGPSKVKHPVIILDITRGGLDGGIPGADGAGVLPSGDVSTDELTVPASFNGFLYAVHGDWVLVGGDDPVRVPHNHVATLPPLEDPTGKDESKLRLKLAKGDHGRVLVFLGEPIKEPVASRGPFVMNTESEIRDAIRDYHAGRF
jgi:quercetin 2,3-dioxygenase